jgi:hypothetical protein
MPLQDPLDEYKKGFQAKAPKEALAVSHRATKDLADSGILARTIKGSDRAPDLILKHTGSCQVPHASPIQAQQRRCLTVQGPGIGRGKDAIYRWITVSAAQMVVG